MRRKLNKDLYHEYYYVKTKILWRNVQAKTLIFALKFYEIELQFQYLFFL